MPGLRQRRWTFLALFGIAASVRAQRPTTPLGADSAADSAEIARHIDALFAERVRPDGPGCAVGVYRDGDVVLARGYGVASLESRRPITPRTTFDLGSASAGDVESSPATEVIDADARAHHPDIKRSCHDAPGICALPRTDAD